MQQQKAISPLQKYRALTPSAQLLQNREHREELKKPKAVIFDLGGVVVPSPLPIFQQFEAKYGLKEGSLVDTIKLSGEDGAFAKLERGEISVECFSEPFARDYLAHIGVALTAEQVAEFVHQLADSTKLNPVSGVIAMIEKLRERGIKTAILTNNFRHENGMRVFPKKQLNVDVVSLSRAENLVSHPHSQARSGHFNKHHTVMTRFTVPYKADMGVAYHITL